CAPALYRRFSQRRSSGFQRRSAYRKGRSKGASGDRQDGKSILSGKTKVTRTQTGLVLVGAFVLLMAYDLFVVIKQGVTISEYMNWIGKTSPVIPLLVGLVAGHFFWPIYQTQQAQGEMPQSTSIVGLCLIAAVAIWALTMLYLALRK